MRGERVRGEGQEARGEGEGARGEWRPPSGEAAATRLGGHNKGEEAEDDEAEARVELRVRKGEGGVR